MLGIDTITTKVAIKGRCSRIVSIAQSTSMMKRVGAPAGPPAVLLGATPLMAVVVLAIVGVTVSIVASALGFDHVAVAPGAASSENPLTDISPTLWHPDGTKTPE